MHYRDSSFLEEKFRDPEVLPSAPAAQGENRLMFHEQENIPADDSALSGGDKTQLEVTGLFVIEQG
jgi:hypothetical protein